MIGYNVSTPTGRAIGHILTRSALADRKDAGWEVKEQGNGGRILVIHPVLANWSSDGEGALVALLDSLSGRPGLNLAWLFDALDEPNRRVAVEAIWMAAGFELVALVAS